MRETLRVKRSCGTHTSSMSCVAIDVIGTLSVVEVRHRQYFSEREHCKLRFGPSLHLATMSAQGRSRKVGNDGSCRLNRRLQLGLLRLLKPQSCQIE